MGVGLNSGVSLKAIVTQASSLLARAMLPFSGGGVKNLSLQLLMSLFPHPHQPGSWASKAERAAILLRPSPLPWQPGASQPHCICPFEKFIRKTSVFKN